MEDTMKVLGELTEYLGLGKMVSEPEIVTGGLMHTMFKVFTDEQVFAIKYLNPIVMVRAGVLEYIEESENIAIALKEEIPLICAKTFNDKAIVEYKENYYIVFEWHEGKSIIPPEIRLDHCIKIGRALGKIHKLSSHNKNENRVEPIEAFPWDKYLELGKMQQAVWLEQLQKNKYKLERWNQYVIEAANLMICYQVLSHRDLDPKNVIWNQNEPLLIDWEAAGYINPHQELIEVINYWCDDGNGQLIYEFVEGLVNAYKEFCTLKKVPWKTVINSGYGGMLGWLDYNLKRSLGIEATTEEEKEMGTRQVLGTIEELIRYEEKTKELLCWLEIT